MNNTGWKQEFASILNQFGHRNWILVTDKAFPKQSSPGMKYIETGEDLTTVLNQVMSGISLSAHVKPVIYTDKELNYITEEQVKGISTLKTEIDRILNDYPVQTLLHEEVFKKLDESSDLFETLVLKTNCTMPYTSIFIFLDCAYWSDEKEKQLRARLTEK